MAPDGRIDWVKLAEHRSELADARAWLQLLAHSEDLRGSSVPLGLVRLILESPLASTARSLSSVVVAAVVTRSPGCDL